VIRALLQMYSYYGNDFIVECPTGSGNRMTLFEVADDLAKRLNRIFLVDKDGHRPVHGKAAKFQNDPAWRGLLLFYEYFNCDTGEGLGASHQTGWTALIAGLIRLFGTVTPEDLLKHGTIGAVDIMKAEPRRTDQKSDVHATMLHDPVAQMLEQTGELPDKEEFSP
jgi:hypothetical protein